VDPSLQSRGAEWKGSTDDRRDPVYSRTSAFCDFDDQFIFQEPATTFVAPFSRACDKVSFG